MSIDDVFKSTVHRAINRSGVRRYSIPLFFGTDYDVKLVVRSLHLHLVLSFQKLILFLWIAVAYVCFRRHAVEISSRYGRRLCSRKVESGIRSLIAKYHDVSDDIRVFLTIGQIKHPDSMYK